MYAKHGKLVDADTPAPKPHLESCLSFKVTHSRITESLKSRRETAYYCIMMWA